MFLGLSAGVGVPSGNRVVHEAVSALSCHLSWQDADIDVGLQFLEERTCIWGASGAV